MNVCWVSGIYIYTKKNLIYPNISQQQQATIGHSELHNLICSEIGWESSDGVEMVFRVNSKVRRYRRWEGEGPQLLMGCPEQMWALFITTDQRAFFMSPGLRIKKGATSSWIRCIYRYIAVYMFSLFYVNICVWLYFIENIQWLTILWKLKGDRWYTEWFRFISLFFCRSY